MMKNILISAFADEYSSDIHTQIAVLKENGINYLEPRFIDGKNVSELTSIQAADLAKALCAADIGVSAIGSPLGKVNLADDFAAHLEKTKRVCDIAAILGAKNIRMFSFYMPEGASRADCYQEVIDRLGKMLDIADEHGVTLCHENEAKIFGESPEDCLKLIKAHGGRLRAVFDMGNFVLDGYRPYPDAYELLCDYVEYFHIKDALYAGAIVPPGLGEASIKEILTAHSGISAKPFFATLEPHLQTFTGLNSLVGKSFDNPYKFENERVAFLCAIKNLKELTV